MARTTESEAVSSMLTISSIITYGLLVAASLMLLFIAYQLHKGRSPGDTKRHKRDHETLAQDHTVDPIFLFQSRRLHYDSTVNYDSDAEAFRDDDGEEVSTEHLANQGLAHEYWTTEYVFLTRADGDEWGKHKTHRYPNGWRVFCVCAKGDLVDVLSAATEGGRYR